MEAERPVSWSRVSKGDLIAEEMSTWDSTTEVFFSKKYWMHHQKTPQDFDRQHCNPSKTKQRMRSSHQQEVGKSDKSVPKSSPISPFHTVVSRQWGSDQVKWTLAVGDLTKSESCCLATSCHRATNLRQDVDHQKNTRQIVSDPFPKAFPTKTTPIFP
jgi:hypothetical protein